MNISAYHIQNVIISYSQRMGRKDPLAQKNSDSASASMSDTISISDDGKKAQLTRKIAQDILSFMNGDTKEEIEFAKRLIERLGGGSGGQIESMQDQKQQTEFRFKVVNVAKEETIKELSLENVKTMIGKISKNT